MEQINDRIYHGTDLTVKFASEISVSPYNGDPWAWIKGRIQARNFAGIHVCDYIPFTTTNGVALKAQIAGINTYQNVNSNGNMDFPWKHIDFICKELWSDYHSINKDMYNNGTSSQHFPWLASDLYLYLNSLSGNVPDGDGLNPQMVAVDYTEDGVYYYLPEQLKNVIIEKYVKIPTRYSETALLTDNNSSGYSHIGKLWLPDEYEVYGAPIWGGSGHSCSGTGLQYPIFVGNLNRLKYQDNFTVGWWLLSPAFGETGEWCCVDEYGACNKDGAYSPHVGVPICFRIGYGAQS